MSRVFLGSALFVAAALLAVAGSPQAQKADTPPDSAAQSIKAEVRGVLHFEAGHTYYVSVKSAEKPDRETRVWLWISEDKVMVRQLENLTDKPVLVEGNLEQMPANMQASVPPEGMYLSHFEIKGRAAK
ncbi:MAG TPA: hypothetical protein VFE24_05770 [Pirellulales bacterium]|jgi:hypothetical protein|nr:hypothetical protein [Pirellulales bacterium]